MQSNDKELGNKYGGPVVDESKKALRFWRDAVRKMERDIQLAAEKAVAELKDITGLTPSEISIYMLNVTALGDSEDTYVVGKVSANVRL